MWFYLVWTVLSTLLEGLTVMSLWQWFVEPLGVHAVGFWHAIGLSTLVTVFRFNTNAQDPEVKGVARAVTYCLFLGLCLLTGYLAHVLS